MSHRFHRVDLLAIVPGIFLVAWLLGPATLALRSASYPASESVIDVTRPPYSAKADGITDDTESLQRAFNDHVGRHRILYFPKGTYLVSATLKWPKSFGGRDNWGKTFLCGESREASVFRLKDGTFTDPTKPQAILWCGGFGSADWFHNYVENLTFDVGSGNPGAVALQFYSNNSGAVRNCRFVAGAGSGHTGLDLAHRDMNGPLLVRNCEVVGFRRGIATGRAVNGQVFENLFLSGQSEVGFVNEGQAISIRGLSSSNAVPALSTYGTLCLVEATLTGVGAASQKPGIINFNGGRLFLRDIRTSGYKRDLGDVSHTPDSAAAYRLGSTDQPATAGPTLAEYASHPATQAFPSPKESLRLPVKETPEVPADPPANWANATDFGADPHGVKDSSEAIQLNIENEGSDVWILGYKTERGGTLLATQGGGRSEVLGGFSYTTTAGKLAPMFVNRDSSVWAFFSEVCYDGDPFAVRVQETRGTETKSLGKEQGSTTPYSGRLPKR